MITSFTLKYTDQLFDRRNNFCPTCKGAISFYHWKLDFKVNDTFNHIRNFCSEECASMYLIRGAQQEDG